MGRGIHSEAGGRAGKIRHTLVLDIVQNKANQNDH